jgi:hypothetical protein
MAQTLFGELKIETFFDVSYVGPSFQGAMEIGDLGIELAGLKDCLGAVIKVLRKHGKIDFNLNDVEIFIEAFEKGSFKNRVKFLKKANKHFKEFQPSYVCVSAVIGALASIVLIVLQYGPKEVNRMSPELMHSIADEVKIELLLDKNFKQSLINITTPIKSGEDGVVFKDSEGNEKINIGSEEHRVIIGLKEEEETSAMDTFGGRISEMDLDALKNQIGFKINGKGMAIPCSFSPASLNQPVDVKEYIPFLGKWVQIDGNATKKGKVINHIDVKNISEIRLPKQGSLLQSNLK